MYWRVSCLKVFCGFESARYNGFSIAEDGVFSCPSDAEIKAKTAPFMQLGMTVGVAVGLAQEAVETGRAIAAVRNITAVAARNRLTSLMLDYEPATNITLAHAEAYAAVIQALV